MKKVIMGAFCLLIAVLPSFTQELNFSEELSFYLPYQEEINDFFSFNSYLTSLENGNNEIDEEVISALFDRFYGKNKLHSLALESFFF